MTEAAVVRYTENGLLVGHWLALLRWVSGVGVARWLLRG